MRRTSHWWKDSLVALVYALLTILMTWPVVLRLNTHFVGQSSDVWLNPWATWWTEQVLSTGQNLYQTDRLFYPHGVSLAFHSFSHVNTALTLLFRPLFGDLGAHNVTVLLAHALSGYAMFCLVRYLTRSSAGAFLSGFVFAFFPYRLSESVHPVLVSTQWMPLYFLCLLRLLRERRKRFAVAAALFFLLIALSSWHLMLFTAFLAAAYLCYLLLFERRRWSRTMVCHLVSLAIVTCVAVAPFMYPLARELLTAGDSYIGVDLDVGRGNDMMAFLLPADEHPFLGNLVETAHERIDDKHDAYMGVSVIGLSIVGCLRRWRRARFWLLLAVIVGLFSIGPSFKIYGLDTGILIPWSVPVVWLFRHPFRLNLLLGFALAVTSGLGLSVLVHWAKGKRSRWLWSLTGVVVALVVTEYLYLPFPTTAAVIPSFYSHLSATPRQDVILDLPMGRQPSKRYMHYQTVHAGPILEGHVSRTPLAAYSLVETNPLLRSLRACGEKALPPANLAPALGVLSEEGVDYVILHKGLVRPISLDTWLEVRVEAPDYEDEYVAVYDTQQPSASPAGQAQLLEGCIAVRSPLADALVTQGETIDVPVEWLVGSSVQEALVLELALVDEAGRAGQHHRYEVSDALMEWDGGYRKTMHYPFQVDPLTSPGTYSLRSVLVPVDGEGESVLSAELLDVQVLARPRSFAAPEMRQTVDATCGRDLHLLGYDLEIDAAAVRLTLHWRALRRMDVDYKMFVHLVDPLTEAVVAQSDVMPHGWAYPTTWWEADEVVSDSIRIALEDVRPGQYWLIVGVYSPDTGERLLVSDAREQSPYPDRLLLDTVSLP
jgi:hypothetical protein